MSKVSSRLRSVETPRHDSAEASRRGGSIVGASRCRRVEASKRRGVQASRRRDMTPHAQSALPSVIT